MMRIPTLHKRVYDLYNHKLIDIVPITVNSKCHKPGEKPCKHLRTYYIDGCLWYYCKGYGICEKGDD